MNWLRGAGTGHHDRDVGRDAVADGRVRGDDGAPETPVHRWAIQAFKGAFLPGSSSSTKLGVAVQAVRDDREPITAMPTKMPAASHRLAELRRSTSYPPVQAHGTPTGIMRTPGLGRDTVERKKSVKFSTHLASHSLGTAQDGGVAAVADEVGGTRRSNSRSGLPEAFPGKFPSPYTPRPAHGLHSRGAMEDGAYDAEAVDSPSNEARDRSRRRSGSTARSGPPPRSLSLTELTTTPCGPPPAKGLALGERSARSVNTRFALSSAAAALDASRSATTGAASHNDAPGAVVPAVAEAKTTELDWELDGDVDAILACVERNNAHLERMIEEMQRLAQSDDFGLDDDDAAATVPGTARRDEVGDGDGDADTTTQLDQPKSRSGKFWLGRFRQLDGMVAACRAEQDRMHAAVAALQSGRALPSALGATTTTTAAAGPAVGVTQAQATGASTSTGAATPLDGMAATPGKVKLEARWRERLAKQQREHEAAVQKVRDATAGGRETRELRRQIKLLQESQSQSHAQSQAKPPAQPQPPLQPKSQVTRGRFATARSDSAGAKSLAASTADAPQATPSQPRPQPGAISSSRFARVPLASSRGPTATATLTTSSGAGAGTGTGASAASRAPMSATSRRIASLSSQSSQESGDVPAADGPAGGDALARSRRLSRSVSRDSGNGTSGRSFGTSMNASATTTAMAATASTVASSVAGRDRPAAEGAFKTAASIAAVRAKRSSFVLKDDDAHVLAGFVPAGEARALQSLASNTLAGARTRQTGAAGAIGAGGKAESLRTPRPTPSRFTSSVYRAVTVGDADKGPGAEGANEKQQRMEAARRRLEDRKQRRRQDAAPTDTAVHVQ